MLLGVVVVFFDASMVTEPLELNEELELSIPRLILPPVVLISILPPFNRELVVMMSPVVILPSPDNTDSSIFPEAPERMDVSISPKDKLAPEIVRERPLVSIDCAESIENAPTPLLSASATNRIFPPL